MLSDKQIIAKIKKIKSHEDLDEYFGIDIYCKGGFVNHYRLLDMLGNHCPKKADQVINSYLFEKKHTIVIDKNKTITCGLIHHIQYMIDFLDGYTNNLDFYYNEEKTEFDEWEKFRVNINMMEYFLNNIELINRLLPIFKSGLLSNCLANKALNENKIYDYVNHKNYGEIILSQCKSYKDEYKFYYLMKGSGIPRPPGSHPSEMDGLLCSTPKKTREMMGVDHYHVRQIKDIFSLKKRQVLLKRFKLLDPFFVQCIHEGLVEFEGDKLVLEYSEDAIDDVLGNPLDDVEFDDVHLHLESTLMRVFNKKNLPDSWVLLKPMNLGPLKLPKNNFYNEWISHLQTNLQDWNNKFAE